MGDPAHDVYRFAEFLVRPDELQRSGNRANIDPAPLQLLRYLIANRSRTVGREELKRVLWPGQPVDAVSDDALDKRVDRVRDALGRKDQARFIETRPKLGYKFIGDVEICVDAAGTDLVLPHLVSTQSNPTIANIYVHSTGRFERQPDGRWFEYNDANAVIYTFEEFEHDKKFLYLIDRSRCKAGDPGRPMIMRIPLVVGEAHWSWKNPLKWERFDIMKPKE